MVVVHRKFGWRYDNTYHNDRQGFHFRKQLYCDNCLSEDQVLNSYTQCRECLSLACTVSEEGRQNEDPNEPFPGLISDPGWSTIVKPKRLLELFHRTFTGPLMGSNNTDKSKNNSVAFQDDPGFAGECQSEGTGSFLFGLSCGNVGERQPSDGTSGTKAGFCAEDGTLGSWFTQYPMPSTNGCKPRYVRVSLEYVTGYDGTVGGWRSLTYSDIEVFGPNGVKIVPPASGVLTDGDVNTFTTQWSDGYDLSNELYLGSAQDVRSIIITSRTGRWDSLQGAKVELYSGSGASGCLAASFDISHALPIYLLGDPLPTNYTFDYLQNLALNATSSSPSPSPTAAAPGDNQCRYVCSQRSCISPGNTNLFRANLRKA